MALERLSRLTNGFPSRPRRGMEACRTIGAGVWSQFTEYSQSVDYLFERRRRRVVHDGVPLVSTGSS
ncbi:hypothetical protein [Amycolatopsis japonica]